jgi:hypothetical protein
MARQLRALCRRPENACSDRTAWWWMQSTTNQSQHANSPDIRKLTGNLGRFRLPFCDFDAERRANSMACNQFPYAKGTGNFQTPIRENF